MPGRLRWTESHAIPILAEGSAAAHSANAPADARAGASAVPVKPAAVVLLLRDVTEERATRAELADLRRRLDALARVHGAHPAVGASDGFAVAAVAAARVSAAGARLGALSPRERETVALLAAGATPKEAAHALGVGAGTVYTVRDRCLKKLALTDPRELTAAWRASGSDGGKPLF